MKRTVGFPVRIWKASDWTLGRGWPPQKWRERMETE
jgi:hypothetical protein